MIIIAMTTISDANILSDDMMMIKIIGGWLLSAALGGTVEISIKNEKQQYTKLPVCYLYANFSLKIFPSIWCH